MTTLLFLTTSTLASNPRLVKEIEALKNENNCTAIYFKQNDWSYKLTKQIIERNPDVRFICIDRKAKPGLTIVSKLIHKLAILLNSMFRNDLAIAAYASNDKTFQLHQTVKSQCKTNHFSSIIAHNLGAFYPALKANKIDINLQLDI